MGNADEHAGQTILVIDDEIGPRESIRFLLKDEYRILCASSVKEGLRMLEEHQPDMVILDIRMPDTSGIEGLRMIREKDSDISVVMLTGFGALETAQQAMRLGANDYLNKPFDTNEMRQVVRKYAMRTHLMRKRAEMLRQLHEVNQRLLDDLTEKDQLAQLGQSSAEFAHDLRNPLMIVSGYVDLLAKQIENSKELMGETYDQAADYLDVIGQNVRRCCELSQMWRKYGKSGSDERVRIGVSDLLEEVVDSVAPLASSGNVQVDSVRNTNGALLMANRPQLVRALHNVLANAVQATPAGTGWVRVIGETEDGRAVVQVKDNGCGMTSDVLDRIFDPYFSTKDEEKGTGLGMVITRKILEEHGGTIEVQSEAGKGTDVTIRLPLYQPVNAA